MATRYFEPDDQPPAPRVPPKRVALIVGNGDYVASRLSNPPRDAALIGRALESVGFDTEVVINADKHALETAIVRLGERIEQAGEEALGFFYFAGHGIQHQGVNYMVPVGTKIPDVRYLKSGAVAVEYLVEEFGGKPTQAAVIVLDACRDNRISGTSGGLTRGLAAIQGLPNGTIVAFATAAGQVAEDGAHGHSPYSTALAARLMEPNRRLEEIFFLIAQDVALATGNTQHPALFMQGVPPPIVLRPEPGPQTLADAPPATLLSAELVFPRGSESRPQREPRPDSKRLRIVGAFALGLCLTVGAAIWWPPMVGKQSGRQQEFEGRPQSQPQSKPLSPSRLAAPLTPDEEHGLHAKASFKECASCPEVVVVRAGSFRMGAPNREEGQDFNEGPIRLVTFARPFAVGRFAVTFDEWDACVADRGCDGYLPDDNDWGQGRRPVINVSWEDAKNYISWLSHKTGKTYRLLSEAEREYMTRAGESSQFWFGPSISTGQANYNSNSISNFKGNLKNEYRRQTVPVDSFEANSFGLYQVHGNVWEWTEDCWHGNYESAPTDGSARRNGACEQLVLRGGSWSSSADQLRAAYRHHESRPARKNTIGFRVARTIN